MVFALVENCRQTHNMLCLRIFNARKAARLIIYIKYQQQFDFIDVLYLTYLFI